MELKVANNYDDTEIQLDWTNEGNNPNLNLLSAIQQNKPAHAMGIIRKNSSLCLIECKQLVEKNWKDWQNILVMNGHRHELD